MGTLKSQGRLFNLILSSKHRKVSLIIELKTRRIFKTPVAGEDAFLRCHQCRGGRTVVLAVWLIKFDFLCFPPWILGGDDSIRWRGLEKHGVPRG